LGTRKRGRSEQRPYEGRQREGKPGSRRDALPGWASLYRAYGADQLCFMNPPFVLVSELGSNSRAAAMQSFRMMGRILCWSARILSLESIFLRF